MGRGNRHGSDGFCCQHYEYSDNIESKRNTKEKKAEEGGEKRGVQSPCDLSLRTLSEGLISLCRVHICSIIVGWF